MKKLYLLLLVILVSLLTFDDDALAAEGGYFNNKSVPSIGTGVNFRYIKEVTDNDLNTYVNVRHANEVPVFNFSKPEKVVKYYFVGSGCIEFFKDSSLKDKIITINSPKNGWNDLVVDNVMSIYASSCGAAANTYVYELDFIVDSQYVYETVTDIVYTSSHDSISATWKKHGDAISTDVYIDGVKLENTTSNSYIFKDLKAETEYEIKFVAVYKTGISQAKVLKVKTTEEPIFKITDVEVVDITSKSARIKVNVAKMKSKPNLIYLYMDGKQLGQMTITNQNNDYFYPLNNLLSETEYKVDLKAKFNTKISDPVSIDFKTLVGNKEVVNLSATSTTEDVSLAWKMPEYKALDFARIYRQKNNVGAFAAFFKASTTYEPIFETNGTTFKDLTVKSDTEYTYKVTTVDTKQNETDGKTIKIRTKKIGVSGGGTTKDPNGDYVVTWTKPDTGKIKVMVGGVEYAIVPASDKKIVIPKDKMKFDIIGNPDVLLIPIDDDGNPGTPTKPGGNGNGNSGGIGDIVGGGDLAEVLNPNNTVKGGVQLLAVVGAFVLLGLAFRVVPKLVRMIRNALIHSSENYGKRRVRE